MLLAPFVRILFIVCVEGGARGGSLKNDLSRGPREVKREEKMVWVVRWMGWINRWVVRGMGDGWMCW